MKLIIVFIIVCLAALNNGDDVSDLEALINQKISSAYSYVEPTDYSQYSPDPNNVKILNYGTFDFIIVGAGLSGSVVADRLSQNQNWSVLVLEAGDYLGQFEKIPGMSPYLAKSDYSWSFYTTPQENGCQGCNDYKCKLWHGKGIGGSSYDVNYIRGLPKEYNDWSALGLDKWSYENVLPYFKSLEHDSLDDYDYTQHDYHGTDGFINSRYAPATDLYSAFKEGCSNLNITESDYNAEDLVDLGAVSAIQMTTEKNGERSYSGSLLENSPHENLNVTTNAFVTRLLIDENTAYALEFTKDGYIYKAFTRHEVILAAGAINTARILLSSGVGPKDDLEALDINVFSDVPVGKSYRDQLAFPGLTVRTNLNETSLNLTNAVTNYLNGDGILTEYFGSALFAYFPDINVDFVIVPPSGLEGPIPLDVITNYNQEVLDSFVSTYNALTDLIFGVISAHMKSSGSIKLKSNNPFDFPDVDLNLFSDEDDLENLYNAIQRGLQILETDAFKQINATLTVNIPMCDDIVQFSKEYWYCVIKVLAIPEAFPIASTLMGTNSNESVVDENLKVWGLLNLRIADSGVIPVSLTGSIGSIETMIGEKAADIIKNDYNVTKSY